MDVSIAIEHLVPSAKYSGSLTDNDQEAYNSIVWNDKLREKPSWAEIVSIDAEIASNREHDHKIQKITLVNRCVEAGLIGDIAEMFSHSPVAALQWGSLGSVRADNNTIRQTLEFIGGNVDELLAPEQEEIG